MIKVWDYDTGELEATLRGHTNVVQHLAFSSNGKHLASSSADLTVKLWLQESGRFDCAKTLTGHDHNVSCVEFMPSGDFLLTCSRDTTIKMWEVESGYCVKTLTGHTAWVRSLAVNKPGTILASCGDDHVVRLWNLAKGESRAPLYGHEHVVNAVAFSSGPADTGIAEYLLKQSGGKVSTLKKPKGKDAEAAPGGLHLVSCARDKKVIVWSVKTGDIIFTLIGHDAWVRDVQFHPLGPFVISVSEDKTIRTWNMQTKRYGL